jgi:hypothetical protein
MLFMLLCEWEIFRANQMVPPNMGNSVLIGVGVLLGVAIYTVYLLWSFRLPKEKD